MRTQFSRIPVRLAAAALVAFSMSGVVPPAAGAAQPTGDAPNVADGAAGAWQSGPRARARLIAATTAVGNLAKVPLALEVELDPGWKTYWRSPGDAGIPPAIDWSGSENLGSTDFLWPAPRRFDFFGIETFGYHDRVVFPIDATPAARGEPLVLHARANLLVCDDVCIPHSIDLALSLGAGPAMPSREAQLIARARASVPGDGARAGLSLDAVTASPATPTPTLQVAAHSVVPFDKPDLIVEGPEEILFSAPKVTRSADGTAARFDIAARATYEDGKTVDLAAQPLTLTLVDGNRTMEARMTPSVSDAVAPASSAPAAEPAITLPVILALALLGGLILNLMPCVLPVLAIKLLAVVGHGGGERARVRRGFVASTAGIVTTFLLLAALAVGLKYAGLAVGWGIQFQQPLFIVAMIVVLTLFASNLWGWLEIRLPGTVADVATRAGGHHHETTLAGGFLQGAFATLLATPCSAPFLGTAIGFALSRGPGEIFAVFAALGIGMALPFLAVAAFPGLATRLPRPGPWMVWLKRALGLALAATAVWLVTVLAAQVSMVAAVTVAVLMVLATVALALRAGRVPVFVRGGTALFVAFALLAFVVPAVLHGYETSGSRHAAKEAGSDRDWRPFDRAAIPELVAEGKTVFVDVTADWCITCQVNKQRVVDAGVVAAALADPRVVRMRADWTSPNPEISDFLASYGRYGIPFNIVYGPTAPHGVPLPELLTDSAVLDALAKADRGRKIAAR